MCNMREGQNGFAGADQDSCKGVGPSWHPLQCHCIRLHPHQRLEGCWLCSAGGCAWEVLTLRFAFLCAGKDGCVGAHKDCGSRVGRVQHPLQCACIWLDWHAPGCLARTGCNCQGDTPPTGVTLGAARTCSSTTLCEANHVRHVLVQQIRT